MRWLYYSKLFLVFFGLTVLFVSSLFYLGSRQVKQYNQSYSDLKIQPQAEEVTGLYFPALQNEQTVELHTSLSVPMAAAWYMNNLVGSGWTMDLPSEDLTNREVQQMKLTKSGFRLTVSFISDGNGGTNVFFYQMINKDDVS